MANLAAYASDPPGPITARKSSIWTGPNGLRAGWGLAIFILMIAAMLVAIHFSVPAIRRQFHPPKAAIAASQPGQPAQATPDSASHDITQEAILLIVVFLATWVMSRIEKRPFGQYGLGGNRRRLPQFLQGIVFGFLLLSLSILMLWMGHYIVFDGQLLHGVTMLKYAVVWMIFFAMVGLFEEMFFRGYIQFTLARGIGKGAIGFWIAALLWSFGFGFAHGGNVGESPFGLFLTAFAGIMLCASLWYTRSLWWAIGMHTTWDWAQSYFYGTADSGMSVNGHLLSSHPAGNVLMSGGATGPEGSIFDLLISILIGVVVWLTLRREHDKSTNQTLVNPL